MSYWKRLLSSITGKAKHRLPDQMALLGAPQQLVEKVRRMSEEKQEVAFVSFVEEQEFIRVVGPWLIEGSVRPLRGEVLPFRPQEDGQ